MTRTPDEIKKGLECCADGNIECAGNCVFDDDINLCFPDCVKLLMTNALALIQQLQAQNAEKDARIKQLEAERDAAVEALKSFGGCMACTNANVLKRDSPCKECILDGLVTRDYWMWRGVTKEE